MAVKISPAEKQRIEGQNWTATDGLNPDKIFVMTRGGCQLGHQKDGACVFLDSNGRCRIHARFGEAAKPLACRLFPLAIHPAGKQLVTSLRFSCPSVAFNRGRALSERVREIRQIANEVVPVDYQGEPPPPLLRNVQLSWDSFARYVEWLDESVADPGVPMALKLMRTFACLRAIETVRPDRLNADRPEKLLGTLSRGIAEKMPSMPVPSERPSRFGFLMFRVLLFEYARLETVTGTRWIRSIPAQTIPQLIHFIQAKGRIPALRPEWGSATFETVAKPFGQLPPDAELTLARFYRVKIQGLHFCGQAQDGLSFVEGFHGLALLFPVILCLSRWRAAGEGRSTLLSEDITRSMMAADHHYGYSARLGSRAFRKMVRLLAQRDDIGHLCAWYSQ